LSVPLGQQLWFGCGNGETAGVKGTVPNPAKPEPNRKLLFQRGGAETRRRKAKSRLESAEEAEILSPDRRRGDSCVGSSSLFSECSRRKSKASVGVGRIIIDMVQRAEGRRTSGKRAGPGGPAQTWGSAPLERTALRSLTRRRRNQTGNCFFNAEARRRGEKRSKVKT